MDWNNNTLVQVVLIWAVYSIDMVESKLDIFVVYGIILQYVLSSYTSDHKIAI